MAWTQAKQIASRANHAQWRTLRWGLQMWLVNWSDITHPISPSTVCWCLYPALLSLCQQDPPTTSATTCIQDPYPVSLFFLSFLQSSFPVTCTTLECRARKVSTQQQKVVHTLSISLFDLVNLLSIRPCTSMKRGSLNLSRFSTESVSPHQSISSSVRCPTSCSYPSPCLLLHTDTNFLQTKQCPAGFDQPHLRPSFYLMIDNFSKC